MSEENLLKDIDFEDLIRKVDYYYFSHAVAFNMNTVEFRRNTESLAIAESMAHP